MSTTALLLLALAAASVGFAVLFVIARRIQNFGIVDIAWALGFAPVAALYGHFAGGTFARRLLITAMAALWSLRLGGYLARRVLGHLRTEDGRYQQLRRDWAANLNAKMFGFFQFQALLLVALSLPFLLAARNPAPDLHLLEFAGAALWLLALLGETLADAQLAAFKGDPANRGQVCDAGLWRLSRHPNYFFEWLVWVAFALFALASPWGWVAIYCPALMLFFLLKVTGIKYTEDQLLRSKGNAYRRYQERTSAFVPWPPRRAAVWRVADNKQQTSEPPRQP
jgi:steroid 5-alpha reductase family enzyme